MKLVAVTFCPAGIIHSQMAAENLLQAGERLGHDIDVEVQGAMGMQDELASDAIAEADAVIVTSNTSISRDRFDDKLILKGMVKDGVNSTGAAVQKAVEFVEAGKAGSVTFGSGDDGEDADVGADDSSDDIDAAESDEPVRRGGDPEKGLSARPKKLFS